MNRRIDRRGFLRGAAGAATVAAIATPLTACSPTSNTKSGIDDSAVTLPTFAPYEKVKPDLPGDSTGVQPAFLAYPAEPENMFDSKPGTGGSVSAICGIYTAVPPGVDKNAYWQALNDRLGVELSFTMAPAANYADKLAITMAGNDIPDFVQIQPQPNLPQLLETKFTNLTEFLSGDAVRNYRGLANIPTASWRSAIFNGGIYGIPLHRNFPTNTMVVRSDLAEKRGISVDVSSADEFLELCRAFTDPSKNKWASGHPSAVLQFALEMLEGTNGWRESGGKFTHYYETEEAKKALDFVAGMWKDQLFHPDSYTQPSAGITWERNNTISVFSVGTAWNGVLLDFRSTTPDFDLAGIVPPKFNGGGKAPKFLGGGVYSMTAIKKSTKDHAKDLLRILDWLAAPFGTEEYLFTNYGTKDAGYTLKGTDPVLTDKGRVESTLPVRYVSAPPVVHYAPGHPDIAQNEYAYEKATVPTGVRSASTGLFSDANQVKGPTLTKTMNDMQSEIIQGRKQITAWDDAVAQWRKSGGDEIREQFESAFEKAQG